MEERYSFIEGLLDFLNQVYEEGRLILLKGLKKELKLSEDWTQDFWRHKFCKNKDFIDRDTEPEIVKAMAEVMGSLDKKHASDEAQITEWTKILDPWLIIYAKYYQNKDENAFILTDEKNKNDGLKIPYLADKVGIKCIGFQNFLEKEGKKVKLV